MSMTVMVGAEKQAPCIIIHKTIIPGNFVSKKTGSYFFLPLTSIGLFLVACHTSKHNALSSLFLHLGAVTDAIPAGWLGALEE